MCPFLPPVLIFFLCFFRSIEITREELRCKAGSVSTRGQNERRGIESCYSPRAIVDLPNSQISAVISSLQGLALYNEAPPCYQRRNASGVVYATPIELRSNNQQSGTCLSQLKRPYKPKCAKLIESARTRNVGRK